MRESSTVGLESLVEILGNPQLEAFKLYAQGRGGHLGFSHHEPGIEAVRVPQDTYSQQPGHRLLEELQPSPAKFRGHEAEPRDIPTSAFHPGSLARYESGTRRCAGERIETIRALLNGWAGVYQDSWECHRLVSELAARSSIAADLRWRWEREGNEAPHQVPACPRDGDPLRPARLTPRWTAPVFFSRGPGLTRSWRSGKIPAMAMPSSARWEGWPLKRLHAARSRLDLGRPARADLRDEPSKGETE